MGHDRAGGDRSHTPGARATYDAHAAHYDLFTAHHDYEGWTRTVEDLARAAGLRGKRLLDVGCGTGASFLPFLERGYEITACDLSPEMLDRARARAAGRARLSVQDARALPVLGAFDLVCCLDDVLNYCGSGAELVEAFRGIEGNLAPGGVVVFDTNTLLAYRTFFATTTVVQAEDTLLIWLGETSTSLERGGISDAEHLALDRQPDGTWVRTVSRHRQYHHSEETVRAALADAGLAAVDVYGMQVDGSIEPGFEETANSKALYVARRAAGPTPDGSRDAGSS